MVKTKIAENIKEIKNTNISIKEARNKDKVLWPSINDIIGAPGNRKLLAGNTQAGWFGEVPSSDFITGDALANLVGITAGRSQYSNEPWLKFAYEGDVLLVTKKPIRNRISWDNINAANCVYGDRVINIQGKYYKIMLLRGIGKEIQQDARKCIDRIKGTDCYNSMWNRLMLAIHVNAPNNWDKENVKIPTSNWQVGYTDIDLGANQSDGSYTWCQETINDNFHRQVRGYYNISFSGIDVSGAVSRQYGWRPCLKLVG